MTAVEQTSTNVQISFSVKRETIKELRELLRVHPFFIDQYKKGYNPDVSKVLRVGASLFIKLLEANNTKAISLASELFERSCDFDLLLDCVRDTKPMEVKVKT